MPEDLWNRMTAPELRARAAQGAPVLLPVGSTEQHGPHLPTGVDDFLSAEACRRAAAIMADHERPVVVAPSLWCGLSDHHLAFGGTFTLTLRTYHALLRDLCRSIITAGFGKILIVNGHGGNITALNAISNELTRELSTPIAVTSYFLAGLERTAEILETQPTLMHACEGETSMIMAIAPDLVDRSRLAEATGPHIALQSDASHTFHVSRPFKEVTCSGVAGDARAATPEKGEAILDTCARAIAEWLLKWA
ncbi:creatininase [Streptomyces pluripotens]|uniref:Creatininase n=1 Tax=Streptomyces pluripotens TaxID=1355015 RepID=A0A221P6U0_9ACTN|nr:MULTISPECIES: creatininase family protein [Streptomyces]ARP73555.1 creatininase [Streptomyces pluripotens]ASN27806.1 creatininase [Streptomyces pluripotens]KIE26794.1 creatininase [Streptomyces sp. MUSC 125]MCH0557260.1 creatininase family protein [Streptomyces sp. MUM 16J]